MAFEAFYSSFKVKGLDLDVREVLARRGPPKIVVVQPHETGVDPHDRLGEPLRTHLQPISHLFWMKNMAFSFNIAFLDGLHGIVLQP